MTPGKIAGLIIGFVVFFLLIILPSPAGLSEAGKNTGAVVLLMSIWWITEAIPIYATAFLPLVLFPILKILPAGQAAVNYGHNYVLMMLAGFIIAKAIEKQNLHKRISLVLIQAFGTNRRRIIFSIMLATAFMSMWIANVTAAVLMLPIALAVISKEEEENADNKKFARALMLGVAYSATIGGIGTLIGSPTNLILVGIMEKLFPDSPPITFFSWLKVGLPLFIVLLPVTWYYLIKYYRISGNLSKDHTAISHEMKQLGKMSGGEKGVMFVFLLAIFGWVFREGFQIGSIIIPGWGELLGVGAYVHDSTVAMLCALLLFILPAGKQHRLMDWKSASQVPWGVVMIVGGGYAVAEGFKVTGLAQWLGNSLIFMYSYPSFIVLVIVVVFIMFFTEVNSNTATVNIFLPVLASMAVAGNTNPLLLMIPATIASSFSFMMPAGTGPNTVVFASERISIADMAKCGLWLKFITLGIMIIMLYFVVMPGLHLQTSLPAWAK